MIKFYISLLSAQNKKLQKDYGKIRLILIIIPLLLFIIYFSTAFLIRDFGSFLMDQNRPFLPFVISLGSYLSVIFVYKLIFIPVIEKYKSSYNTALQICNQIVDKADWSNFRKRELSNNRRSQVIETVEEFYSIRNKHFFPYQTINSYYPHIKRIIASLNILILIEIMTISIFTIFPSLYFNIKDYLATYQ